MKLIKTKKYTKCMLRLYEEDYSDIDILNLIQRLKDELSLKISCAYHTKDNAKPHYHLVLSRGDFRPSALYRLGIREHECSDMEDLVGSYLYIMFHKGKEQQDKENNHHIDIIYDDHKIVPNTTTKTDIAYSFLEWYYAQEFEKPFSDVASFVRFVHFNASQFDTFVSSHTLYIYRLLNI